MRLALSAEQVSAPRGELDRFVETLVPRQVTDHRPDNVDQLSHYGTVIAFIGDLYQQALEAF